jgi:hypothetical protein
MLIPKYRPGQLVLFDEEIHEVLRVEAGETEPYYQTIVRAFVREMRDSEWHQQITPQTTRHKESELRDWPQSEPKFKIGERVKLRDNECVIRFIRYEHHHYEIFAMSIENHSPTGRGWQKEESYFGR